MQIQIGLPGSIFLTASQVKSHVTHRKEVLTDHVSQMIKKEPRMRHFRMMSDNIIYTIQRWFGYFLSVKYKALQLEGIEQDLINRHSPVSANLPQNLLLNDKINWVLLFLWVPIPCMYFHKLGKNNTQLYRINCRGPFSLFLILLFV